MEFFEQLTISAETQLLSINSHAARCIRQIDQHQRLSGQTANWAPRLSFAYYWDRVDNLIGTLKNPEDALVEMNSKPGLVDDEAIKAARKNADSAQTRMTILRIARMALLASQLSRSKLLRQS